MTKHDVPTVRSLIDAHENPFVLIDRQYRIVAANRAYCEAYGVRNGDLLGKRCYQVSHHRDSPCHLHGEDCPHQQVFNTGQTHEVLHIHYDQAGEPEKVRILGHSIRGVDGEPLLGESIHRLDPVGDDADTNRMIGCSSAFMRMVEQLGRAAETEASILIEGESGVGKELAARFVHDRSPRRDKPFVSIDCTTLTETLIEAELFGHEAGAFTGSIGRKAGLVEWADGGTLFLDEIGDLPLNLQPKLLRLLEHHEFRRVGGHEMQSVDVRIVAATNRRLREQAHLGRFRQDLYYRLACITVAIPPLRDRSDDIPALADALLQEICNTSGRRCHLSREALACLTAHEFPGNVRELRNALQRAVVMTSDGTIRSEDLDLGHGIPEPREPRDAPAPVALREMEARYIATLLERHCGHRRRVADDLGISERTLYRKLRTLGLN
jgi:transcriptional regulator with PAS, ATPase and Fis domain